MAESASNSYRNVIGVSLIAGSLVLGFVLFLFFPMPQEYTTLVGGVEQSFTTECTTNGGVIWSPSPALNPDHVAQAEDYCEQWSGTVVVLSFALPLIGALAGAFILARPRSETTSTEDAEQPSITEGA